MSDEPTIEEAEAAVLEVAAADPIQARILAEKFVAHFRARKDLAAGALATAIVELEKLEALGRRTASVAPGWHAPDGVFHRHGKGAACDEAIGCPVPAGIVIRDNTITP